MSPFPVVDRRRIDSLGNPRVPDEGMGERCEREMKGSRCQGRGEHRVCFFELESGRGVRHVFYDGVLRREV